jgi:hypothetical protein
MTARPILIIYNIFDLFIIIKRRDYISNAKGRSAIGKYKDLPAKDVE